MNIDINLVKKLRDATYAPLGDCKNALVEAEGDLEKAQEILRKKGIAKAGKKAGRETNE
jgi:elongation factor Ts